VSAEVTIFCLLIAYPFAALLAQLSTAISNLLMFFVLLPFWTALLARTTAWIVLLQREGLVNDTLRLLGFTDKPIPLVFNRTGVLIAMTHVLLPFAILPLYSSMRSINPIYMRAARSLGAKPTLAFRRIYFPLTLPGLAASGLLVFILALGYYITPALVGGTHDQFISSFIALYTDTYLNWGQASALAGVLCISVLLLYLVYYKVAGGAQLQLR
jgi:putative spermidine/putrescine transport system permease protein